MSESECEFYGLLRHKYTVDVRFYLFTVGFQKCRIIYGRINETPLYLVFTPPVKIRKTLVISYFQSELINIQFVLLIFYYISLFMSIKCFIQLFRIF